MPPGKVPVTTFDRKREDRDTESAVRGAMIAIGRARSGKQKADATPTPAGFSSHALAGIRNQGSPWSNGKRRTRTRDSKDRLQSTDVECGLRGGAALV
jgi:hypothetical protein